MLMNGIENMKHGSKKDRSKRNKKLSKTNLCHLVMWSKTGSSRWSRTKSILAIYQNKSLKIYLEAMRLLKRKLRNLIQIRKKKAAQKSRGGKSRENKGTTTMMKTLDLYPWLIGLTLNIIYHWKAVGDVITPPKTSSLLPHWRSKRIPPIIFAKEVLL